MSLSLAITKSENEIPPGSFYLRRLHAPSMLIILNKTEKITLGSDSLGARGSGVAKEHATLMYMKEFDTFLLVGTTLGNEKGTFALNGHPVKPEGVVLAENSQFTLGNKGPPNHGYFTFMLCYKQFQNLDDQSQNEKLTEKRDASTSKDSRRPSNHKISNSSNSPNKRKKNNQNNVALQYCSSPVSPGSDKENTMSTVIVETVSSTGLTKTFKYSAPGHVKDIKILDSFSTSTLQKYDNGKGSTITSVSESGHWGNTNIRSPSTQSKSPLSFIDISGTRKPVYIQTTSHDSQNSLSQIGKYTCANSGNLRRNYTNFEQPSTSKSYYLPPKSPPSPSHSSSKDLRAKLNEQCGSPKRVLQRNNVTKPNKPKKASTSRSIATNQDCNVFLSNVQRSSSPVVPGLNFPDKKDRYNFSRHEINKHLGKIPKRKSSGTYDRPNPKPTVRPISRTAKLITPLWKRRPGKDRARRNSKETLKEKCLKQLKHRIRIPGGGSDVQKREQCNRKI